MGSWGFFRKFGDKITLNLKIEPRQLPQEEEGPPPTL